MSSRNQYLTEEERSIAPLLHKILDDVGVALQNGKRDYEKLEKTAIARLEKAGFGIDYVAIRRAHNLASPDRDCDELVVIAAVDLGLARLIDNVVVTI
jgi:pantoate--beta-alanine ligase